MDVREDSGLSPADLTEAHRLLAALVAAIEADDLDSSPGMYGALIGAIVICDTVTAQVHTENGP
jgi:hypothetical protein